MQAYASQRLAKRKPHARVHPATSVERARWLSQVEELSAQHRRQRLAKQAGERAWRAVRQRRKQQQLAYQQLLHREKRGQHAQHEADEAHWRQDRQQRQAEVASQREAYCAWRQARGVLRAEQTRFAATPPPVMAWIAILVVVDNCTRRCLGLASFAAGVHVTAEAVVAALRQILPAGLQFVISDNGTHFCSDAFARLAATAQFVHVRSAPYRACTNGIAERFVRTLKADLHAYTWSGPEDMPDLLALIRKAYDNRPHQGRELRGLSPNEYDRRLRLRAT